MTPLSVPNLRQELAMTPLSALQLDEVALYDHPLSAEEIRCHYRLGTAKVSAE
jgi:hypothetical protein